MTTSCPQTNLWPIEEKESDRWLKGYRCVCELAVACPETQIVMVADREGDIYDIFVEAQEGELPPVNDNYYLARWAVEISFRILKTGWRVEDIQLETMHRLKNCLALYCIIAWRVQYLTYLNRTSPALPCTAVFTASEWKSVWKVVKRGDPPKRPPLLSDFMALLSQLGCYILDVLLVPDA